MPRGHHDPMIDIRRVLLIAAVAGIAWMLPPAGTGAARAQDADAAGPDAIVPAVLRDWLVIASLAPGGRAPLQADPVVMRYVSAAEAPEPREGDAVASPRGEATWQAARADEQGRLRHEALANGWATATFRSPRVGAAVIEVRDAFWLHINGVSHSGDVYRRGRTAVPVPVRAGENRIWLRAIRGTAHVTLREAPEAPFFDLRDNTLPDLRDGEAYVGEGAVLISNPTGDLLVGATLEAGDGERFAVRRSDVPGVLPYAHRKVAVPIELVAPLSRDDADDGRVELPLRLFVPGKEEPVAEARVSLAVRRPHEAFRVTFRSDIDGSVQYYAIRPPVQWRDDATYGIVLSCHGASVEAISQARAYANHLDLFVVCPTNRRPFGFDWEDWGRMDALEVLAHAKATLPVDSRRVYLTGHSMGGHGAWHLGVTYPERFAAIGPSAGWASLFTYGNLPRQRDATAPQEYFARGLTPSDTDLMLENLRDTAIYVLHGDADDNVPVSEARRLVARLREFHENLRYHEEPGAGHWWNGPRSSSTDCVDWPPMFDMFARSRLPVAPREIEFRTSNLAVSHTHHWLAVLGQPRPFGPSRVSARMREGSTPARVELALDNVDRLRLDLDVFFPGRDRHEVEIRIDGVDEPFSTTWHRGEPLYVGHTIRDALRPATDDESNDVEASADTWWVDASPRLSPGARHPARYGLFKDAFRHRFLYVYGTGGDEAMNAAMLEKARFDASTWWYYGNGAADVIPDTHFRPEAAAGRTVILIGNADVNAAFADLFAPDGRDGAADELWLTSTGLTYGGAGLAPFAPLHGSVSLMAVRPKPGCDATFVGIIGGTDPAAMARLLTLRYFRSGLAHPDFTVLLADAENRADTGRLAAAGFFGRDWSLKSPDADWVW